MESRLWVILGVSKANITGCALGISGFAPHQPNGRDGGN
jgi:hypothetical protein